MTNTYDAPGVLQLVMNSGEGLEPEDPMFVTNAHLAIARQGPEPRVVVELPSARITLPMMWILVHEIHAQVAAAGGRLAVWTPHDEVLGIFAVAGLADRFPCLPTEASALAAVLEC